jgi:hypothetical protein
MSTGACACGRDAIGACLDCGRRLCGVCGTSSGPFLCEGCIAGRRRASNQASVEARADRRRAIAQLIATVADESVAAREVASLLRANETLLNREICTQAWVRIAGSGLILPSCDLLQLEGRVGAFGRETWSEVSRLAGWRVTGVAWYTVVGDELVRTSHRLDLVLDASGGALTHEPKPLDPHCALFPPRESIFVGHGVPLEVEKHPRYARRAVLNAFKAGGHAATDEQYVAGVLALTRSPG